VLEPGQGHFPVYNFIKNSSRINRITLAGRDLLQLYTTQHNLLLNGLPAHKLEVKHVSFLPECGPGFDTVLVFPENTPVMNLQVQLIRDVKQYYQAGAQT
jgi:hypothetical protein